MGTQRREAAIAHFHVTQVRVRAAKWQGSAKG